MPYTECRHNSVYYVIAAYIIVLEKESVFWMKLIRKIQYTYNAKYEIMIHDPEKKK